MHSVTTIHPSGFTAWRLAMWMVMWMASLAVCYMLAGCAAPATVPTKQPSAVNVVDAQLETLPTVQAVGLAAGEKLRVIATTTIIADVVSNIGGDHIALTTLIPAGVDPHSYAASPADLKALSEAQVIFENGLQLEESLAAVLENHDGNGVVATVNAGVATIAFNGAEFAGADPHTWMNVQNVIHWTKNIEQVLSGLDPANAAAYAAAAKVYQATLAELDAEVQAAATSLPPDQRKLVTDHEALGYFAQAYGFTIIGALVPSFSTMAAPSAQELAALQDQIKTEGVKAIFVGNSANPTLAEQIANDLGVRVITLYPESLSPADGPAPTYVALMRYNIQAIVAALR